MKKRILCMVLCVVLLIGLVGGCGKSDKNINDFTQAIINETGLGAEYIEDRNVVRVYHLMTTEPLYEASEYDGFDAVWFSVRNDSLDMYESIVKVAESRKVGNVNMEFVIFDETKYLQNEEIPMIVVNDDGVVFDMMKELNRY